MATQPAIAVIFNLVMGFDLRLCAGLSHTVVAIGALGAVLYGLLQPSPTDPLKPLLNFDLAMVGHPLNHDCCTSWHVRVAWFSCVGLLHSQSRLHLLLVQQVLVPSMLFGISFGVVLCPLSPEWVQTVLLSVLLMAVTQKTFSHGMTRWRHEQHERACASDQLL